ncbi:TonB C-terminal domain-containing protein [Hydrogenimonas sp.]
MDRNFLYFFIGGIASILFYLLIIALFFAFFNDRRNATHYVPNRSQSIEVSIMQAPKKPHKAKMMKRKQKESVKSLKKRATKSTPKPPARRKSTSKAVASLFATVKTSKPVGASRASRLANAPKIKYKPTENFSSKESKRAREMIKDLNLSKPSINISSKSGGKGEVDKYMTRIYEILYSSWQPDRIFAGVHATVRMKIAPDGKFDYTILYPSDNQAFNESLIEYLKQLQSKGFPPRKGDKELVVDVEFKAKE